MISINLCIESHLHVAYIDNIRLNRAEVLVLYSVLIKSDGCGSIQ